MTVIEIQRTSKEDVATVVTVESFTRMCQFFMHGDWHVRTVTFTGGTLFGVFNGEDFANMCWVVLN